MEINKVSASGTQPAEAVKTSSQRAFLSESKDTFVKTTKPKKLSLKDSLKEFSRLNNEKWGGRFTVEDTIDFAASYRKNNIDFDIVDDFAKTTNMNIKSISSIYVMEKQPENKNLREKVLEAAKKVDEGNYVIGFKKDVFEPNKEFGLQVDTTLAKNKNEYYEYFDKNTAEKIGKSSKKILRQTYGFDIKTTEEDYRNNTKTTQKEILNLNKGIPVLEKETIEKKDSNGKLIKTTVTEMSNLPGIYNVTDVYPDGKKVDVVKASVDSKTGIKSVKKDMKSSDGTRTEYLYEDDPQGNRIIDYKITDKNGKVLMKNSSTFEVVSDNKFISSKNGHKYEITTNDKGLHVKDINHSGKETSIEFDKKIKGNKEEVISLLKKVPGEELFETVDTIKQINGKNSDELLLSAYNKLSKKVQMADDLFVFLHELGHAKDGEYNNGIKDLIKNNKHVYEQDKNIQGAYLEERKQFNEKFSDAQRNHIAYFIQADGHYDGEWGGLQEVIAEQNAIVSSIPDAPIDCLGIRAQYLQQHFPKTIAEIQNAMNYKNDREAIEFYGT